MHRQFTHFVGIDISKETMNVAVYGSAKNLLAEYKVGNCRKEIGVMVGKVRRLAGGDLSTVVFCLEHTGVYQTPMLRYGEGEGLVMWLANPRSVINASEEEEKNDRLDARKIGLYAIRYIDKFRRWERPPAILEELRALEGIRKHLSDTIRGLKARIGEAKAMGDTVTASTEKYARRTLRGLEKDLADVERAIDDLVAGDEAVSRNVGLLRTIPGIGKRTALVLVVATLNFTRFENARQFAKYCCVAPVHKQSGTSRNGRGKVNKRGRMDIKSVLTMAAWAAIRCDLEIRLFYERKCHTSDRKNKVVNMVRNKLIKRAFAIIARQAPFEREWNPGQGEGTQTSTGTAPVRQRLAVSQPTMPDTRNSAAKALKGWPSPVQEGIQPENPGPRKEGASPKTD
jgi:transposase